MFFSKRKLIAFLFLFCVVFLIFFVSTREAPYTLRSYFSDLSKIPLIIVTAMSNEIRAVLFFHRSYWQNLSLSWENQRLKSRLLAQESLLSENERLRKLLDLKTRIPYKTIAARVIGKDFNALRPYIILNKGRAGGIERYSPVLTPLGLVGKVLEVGRYSSKVILINDPDLSVPALNARTMEQGLVSGSLDGRCKLRFLDLASDIKEGDSIVTSGLNRSYPEGILVGKVQFVGKEPSGMGKFAILEPAVKPASLLEVLIVEY